VQKIGSHILPDDFHCLDAQLGADFDSSIVARQSVLTDSDQLVTL